MSVHIEWADVAYATPRLYIAKPGEIEDAFGTANTNPALVIDEGGDLMMLEGKNADEFIAFAAKVHEAGMRLKNEEQQP